MVGAEPVDDFLVVQWEAFDVSRVPDINNEREHARFDIVFVYHTVDVDVLLESSLSVQCHTL